MGIAMCHFELTSKGLGIDGKWQISDPGSISAPQDTEYVVSWVEVETKKGKELINAEFVQSIKIKKS